MKVSYSIQFNVEKDKYSKISITRARQNKISEILEDNSLKYTQNGLIDIFSNKSYQIKTTPSYIRITFMKNPDVAKAQDLIDVFSDTNIRATTIELNHVYQYKSIGTALNSMASLLNNDLSSFLPDSMNLVHFYKDELYIVTLDLDPKKDAVYIEMIIKYAADNTQCITNNCFDVLNSMTQDDDLKKIIEILGIKENV